MEGVGSVLDGDWSKQICKTSVVLHVQEALCVHGCSLFVFLEQGIARKKEQASQRRSFRFWRLKAFLSMKKTQKKRKLDII